MQNVRTYASFHPVIKLYGLQQANKSQQLEIHNQHNRVWKRQCMKLAQGEVLALRLYHDAVDSNRITWRIPGLPSGPGAGASLLPAPSSALPHVRSMPQAGSTARAPSQAFKSISHASHGAYSQNGTTPPSLGSPYGIQQLGRALEPQGPASSGGHRARPNPSAANARPKPSTARVHSSLLSHPSSSFRVDEEDQDWSQTSSQPYLHSQSASQGVSGKPAVGTHSVAVKQVLNEQVPKSWSEEQILRVMEVADCSYAKAEMVCRSPHCYGCGIHCFICFLTLAASALLEVHAIYIPTGCFVRQHFLCCPLSLL